MTTETEEKSMNAVLQYFEMTDENLIYRSGDEFEWQLYTRLSGSRFDFLCLKVTSGLPISTTIEDGAVILVGDETRDCEVWFSGYGYKPYGPNLDDNELRHLYIGDEFTGNAGYFYYFLDEFDGFMDALKLLRLEYNKLKPNTY